MQKIENLKMNKIVKITESDITNIVKRILEQERSDRYMFFSNLQQIRRQMDILLDMDPDMEYPFVF